MYKIRNWLSVIQSSPVGVHVLPPPSLYTHELSPGSPQQQASAGEVPRFYRNRPREDEG